nr:MAG TPA: hypothetical protein [Caudoviricetes sp.]
MKTLTIPMKLSSNISFNSLLHHTILCVTI